MGQTVEFSSLESRTDILTHTRLNSGAVIFHEQIVLDSLFIAKTRRFVLVWSSHEELLSKEGKWDNHYTDTKSYNSCNGSWTVHRSTCTTVHSLVNRLQSLDYSRAIGRIANTFSNTVNQNCLKSYVSILRRVSCSVRICFLCFYPWNLFLWSWRRNLLS